MDFVIFEANKPLIVKALNDGEFDFMEAASEHFEAEFFRFIKAKTYLDALAGTYPSPRKKEEVPFWFYVAANLSMRLHGVHAYHAFPLVVRCGGLLQAFGAGRKTTHPHTEETTIVAKGFNGKNHYDRVTPCDQDYLRKVSKDTEPEALMAWFNRDVATVFASDFNNEGVFIGDASYLFVPDNEAYEGSVCMRFDEHNHPVGEKEYQRMSETQKRRCAWRRCYKMVTLLHTNAKQEFFLFVGLRVVSGSDHESPVLYGLVDTFVGAVGKGVMKRLILDRGFLDGEAITRCKKEYGIDVLIPIRHNMDLYVDALALLQGPDVRWVSCEEHRRKRQSPEKTLVASEAASIGSFESWSSCTVPLTVIANRETYADGHADIWLLADTKEGKDPASVRREYRLRTAIEERYRQLKCFSDLTRFTSRAFSMVVNQVVFIMLAYDLLQIYLVHEGRKDLNQKTLPRLRKQLMPGDNHVIVYWRQYYGLFEPFELVGLVVTLGEEARKKIAAKCRRIGREFTGLLKNPRPP